jgi:hypothetical protein
MNDPWIDYLYLSFLVISLLMMNCKYDNNQTRMQTDQSNGQNFSDDLQFLQAHTDVLVLRAPDSPALVVVSGGLQGRVMTSTARGMNGRSFGWINRPLFESGDTLEHMNAFGGEERFWLGPEGGQYSIFFKKGDPFDLDHWQTPRLIDLDSYSLRESTDHRAVFEKDASLTNYSGFRFNFRIERTIEMLSKTEIRQNLGLPDALDLPVVGYQTNNQLINTGSEDWKEETGLLSIWLLGMYNPSESTTVIIPYYEGEESDFGPVVNDTYFGKVPEDRLKMKDNVIYFKGDGKYRSKIGLSPARAKNVCGSYDTENQLLTIVQYSKPEGMNRYVNSLWEIQEEPYRGDVINSYNDGPPEPGKSPLGPFYELETSSPALALKKGESDIHIQRTYHFEGEEAMLDQIMQQILGVSVQQVNEAF